MKARDTILAHKYAQAFVAVFGIHSDWIASLDTLAHTFEHNKSLLVLLTLPNISVHQKVTVFRTFFVHIPCLYALERLLTALITDKQVLLMTKVLEKIIMLYHEQQGRMRCFVDSSHTLQEVQKNKIQDFITHSIKHSAHCIFRVNPRLIAGIRIQTPTFFWQHSIRAQLQALRTTLMR